MAEERVKTGGETKANTSPRKKSSKDKFVLVANLFFRATEEERAYTQESDAA